MFSMCIKKARGHLTKGLHLHIREGGGRERGGICGPLERTGELVPNEGSSLVWLRAYFRKMYTSQ
jgi:hypothetical protein